MLLELFCRLVCWLADLLPNIYDWPGIRGRGSD